MPQRSSVDSLVTDAKPATKPVQSKRNQDLALFIARRMQEMKVFRSQFDKHWDTYDRLYLSVPAGEPPEKWMANVFVPFVLSTVLAIQAEITARRETWKILPTTAADEQKVDTIAAITEYTKEKGQWDDESFKRDLDKLIYGTAVWKETYREDQRVLRKRVIHKDGTETITVENVTDFNDVYGKHIAIRSFYVDDKCTDMRNARDCLERTVMDIRDFRTRYKAKAAKKVKGYGDVDVPLLSEKEVSNLPSGGDVNQHPVSTYNPLSPLKEHDVEVIEYWNKPEDRHVIMANGTIVVDEPNPYEHKELPYAVDVAIPVPGRFYGIGIPQLLESSNEELNTIHNMMIDEGKLDINTPLIMGGMTVLDESEYKVRPGGIIAADDATQAVPLNRKGLSASHFKLYEEVKQTARVASGLDVRFAENTSPTGGTDTATEVMRLQESSLRRIGLLSKILEIRCLNRIGMLRTMNIQQFYRDPLKVEMVLNDDGSITTDPMTGKPKYKKVNRQIRTQKDGATNYNFQEIEPEDIRGNFDIQVVPQSTQPMSQAVLVKRISTIIQTVLAYPQALQVVDITELFKQYFKQMDLPLAMVRTTLQQPEVSSVEQANQETMDMAAGKSIPPTPNATVQHTAVHLAWMYEIIQGRPTGKFTPQFIQAGQDVQKIMVAHVTGEEKQHAAKGEVSVPTARTPNVGGQGTQAVAGGQEVPVEGS